MHRGVVIFLLLPRAVSTTDSSCPSSRNGSVSQKLLAVAVGHAASKANGPSVSLPANLPIAKWSEELQFKLEL